MGAVKKTNPEPIKTGFRPRRSLSSPAGRLVKIPVTVDAAAIKPMVGLSAPICDARIGSTGFLERVELNMANPPTAHRIMNAQYLLVRLSERFICRNPSRLSNMK
jgi:hypothetical protein